jgi:RNA polymerase sigma-70 factor (ECF subfamily)
MSVESTASLEELLVHTQWLRALATRLLHDSAGAEDLVQETWIVAMARPPRAGRPVRPWLARVVRNLASNRRRAELRRVEHEQAARRPDAPRPAGEIVAELEAQRVLVEALLQLEEPLRETLVLRYYRGLDSTRIARLQGVPAGTVRRRLKEGIDELRVRLDARFGDSRSSWCLLLEPLLFTQLGAAGPATAAAAGAIAPGVMTMGMSAKVAAAVAVLGIAGGWWWFQEQDDGHGTLESLPATAVLEAQAEPSQPPVSLEGAIEEELDSRRAVPGDVPRRIAFTLLQPDGSPASNARAAACQAGSLAWKGIANEVGEIVVDAGEPGAATLLVLAAGAAPYTQDVVLEPGLQEIRLSLGGVVSGQLFVDGKLPTEAYPLQLRSDHPLIRVEDLGTTWEGLEIDARSATSISGRTGPDGAFRFYGLPAGWKGELTLPRYLYPRDRSLSGSMSNSILLRQAVEGLSIDLVRRIRLYGRIMATPNGKPVARARVDPFLQYPDEVSRSTYQPMGMTDSDGRFELILLSASIRGGSLLISAPDGLLARKVPVEPQELEQDKDLGDLPLVDADSTNTAKLLVVDSTGNPIAGAAAGTDHEAPASMRTGEDGRTVLRGVVPGDSVIEVHALGYEPTEVSVPPQLPEELVVTMRKGTVLELQLRTPSGEGTFPRIVLGADEHPIVGRRYARSFRAYYSVVATAYGAGRSDDAPAAIHFVPDRNGHAVLNAVKPGIPLRLAVVDVYGEVVLEGMAIAPLHAGEHREIVIDLPREPRTLSGRVVDESGAPIADASVSFSTPPSRKTPDDLSMGMSRSTDHLGAFSFGVIFGPTIDLSIQKPGYVSFHDSHFEVPHDGSEVEFRLIEGHELKVILEDERGRRQEGRVSIKRGDGGWIFGSSIGDGAYLLRGLPEEEVVVSAWVHGVQYTRVHSPGDSEMLITLPLLGEVSASIDLLVDPPLDARTMLLVLTPDPGTGLFERATFLEPQAGGWPVTCTLRGVPPGNYSARVVRTPNPTHWKDGAVDVSATHPVQVRAEQTTHVQILH